MTKLDEITECMNCHATKGVQKQWVGGTRVKLCDACYKETERMRLQGGTKLQAYLTLAKFYQAQLAKTTNS